jgi:hypothetical protein
MSQSTSRERACAALLLSLGAHLLLALLVTRLPVWHAVAQGIHAEPAEGNGMLLVLGTPGPARAAEPLPRQPVEPRDEQDMSVDLGGPPALPAAASGGGEPSTVSPGGSSPGTPEPGGVSPGSSSSLFQAARLARGVVFVVDRSISMGPSGALAAARREVLVSLRALPAGARFQVVAYSKWAELPPVEPREEMLPATPETVEAVARWLEELAPEGGTDTVRALRRGLLFRPEVLYLITDAGDLDLPDVNLITRLNAGRTAIHVVELAQGGTGPAEGRLRRLAEVNGGGHRRVLTAP